MSLPLEGIKVMDLAQVFAGPGTAMYLADFGAEVIKVERPGGEDCRNLGATPYLGRESRPFMALNRNKRGMVLDLSKEEGRQVIHRMASWADVLIEGFVPGVAERLGIGYETLSQINPRLIYASVSAFGARGPLARRPGYDLIVQALSGIMAARRTPGGDPIPAGLWVSDCSAPMLLAYGIMLALWEREKTGTGQRVETSLLHAAIAMQSTFLIDVEADPNLTLAKPETYEPYRCQDGGYIAVVILTERQWQNLCRVLQVEHLASDPRFDSVAKRAERNEELRPILEELFRWRPAAEWLGLLQEAQIPSGPVRTRADVFSEPQVLANDLIAEVEHPKVGKTRFFGIPLKLSRTPGQIRRPAPSVGQHTDEILAELGYSPAEMGALRAAGAVQ